jgi:hypothetical protein
MPATDNEQRAYVAITSTFNTLTEWQQRLGAPYFPIPGSDLAADDEDWPPSPVSQVAICGLAAAVDHLSAVRSLIEAKQLFTFTPLSLSRGALIGASQAAWVLAPNDSRIRLRRARTVSDYGYGYRIKYLEDLDGLSDEADEGVDIHLALNRRRRSELAQKREADGHTAKLNATDMIETAASEIFNKASLTLNAKLAWQSCSGAAHGQMWQFHGTTAIQQVAGANEDGIATFNLGGKFSTFSNPYCAAFHIAERAWSLLDLRGTNPEETQ